jgi:hypothetical protein
MSVALKASFYYSANLISCTILFVCVHYTTGGLTIGKMFATLDSINVLRYYAVEIGSEAMSCYFNLQVVIQRLKEILIIDETSMSRIDNDLIKSSKIENNSEAN